MGAAPYPNGLTLETIFTQSIRLIARKLYAGLAFNQPDELPMSRTNRLDLPLLLASQADKHVTYNDAMLTLDACVQLTVVSRALNAPPAEPHDGKCYIPKAPATGAWSGLQDKLIAFQNGGWQLSRLARLGFG